MKPRRPLKIAGLIEIVFAMVVGIGIALAVAAPAPFELAPAADLSAQKPTTDSTALTPE